MKCNGLTRFARTACGTLRVPRLRASRSDARLRLTRNVAFGIQNTHIKVGCAPTESTGFVTKAIQIITLTILPRMRVYGILIS